MKKLAATILSAAFAIGAVCALTACSGEAKTKIIPVALSSEQYGIAVKKDRKSVV